MTKMIPTDNAAFLNAFGMIVGGDTGLNASARRVEIVRIAQSTSGSDVDYVAEEVPIALVYNGISHAVMMATPAQLEEFGIGFSLAEGIVADLSEIYGIEVTEGCRGGKNIELTIASENFWKLKEYRRSMTGRTGCGICGVESLEGAVRPTPRVPFTQTFDLQHYERALNYLHEIEELGRLTGATHAAAWVNVDGSLAGGAEDVGRHVALDKLLGLRAKQGWTEGALVISSRASYEMVQKAAMTGVESSSQYRRRRHSPSRSLKRPGLRLQLSADADEPMSIRILNGSLDWANKLDSARGASSIIRRGGIRKRCRLFYVDSAKTPAGAAPAYFSRAATQDVSTMRLWNEPSTYTRVDTCLHP